MPKNHAEIGKYATENGNERARRYFLGQFPKLTESIVRNFKKAYKEELACQRKKINLQPVTKLLPKPKG